MARRLAASAGHSNVPGQDQGAADNGTIEGVETVRIRNRVMYPIMFLILFLK